MASEATANESSPVVETSHGPVRGLRDRETFVFRGIPYGASTAGEFRFRAPRPPERWGDVRDATEYGPTTIQHKPVVDVYIPPGQDRAPGTPMPMSEDCLFVNVYSRGLGDGKKRPVMVWLHGGGFRTGVGATQATDGVRLTERGDVVVVSLNHRLNVYGFFHLLDLCGADFDGSGQAGLLDIILALGWVRENIEAFGGDPDNVTLFGVSGGGRKICQLLGMPAARGLFHRGIIQSGAHPRGVPRDQANEFAERLLGHMGITPAEISRLQHMPVEELHAGLYGWLRQERDRPNGFGGMMMSPVVDGVHIPDHAYGSVAAPTAAGVPIIIGTTRHEMGSFLARTPDTWANVDEATVLETVRPVLGEHTERIYEATRKNRPEATPYDLLVALTSEDRRQLSLQVAERHAAAGNPTYFYQFAWESNASNGLIRAGHGVDTPLVFDNPDGRPMTGTDPARFDIAALMSETWIQFARNGNPNHEGIPQWERFDSATRHQMVFDLPPHAETDWDREERLAWRDVPVHLPFEGPAFVGTFNAD